MSKYLFLFIFLFIILWSCSEKKPYLKVGLVADPQYANKPTSGKRHYSETLWKLEEAIDTFNYYEIDFVQNLGDIIDNKWESFDAILPIYQKLKPGIENYQLLGNHEFSVDSIYFKSILKRLSMPNYYYSYTKKGWRFIVLDATEYSYYSNALHNNEISQIDFYYKKTNGQPNNNLWNSAIGTAQQKWLKQEIESANLLGQKIIVFSHMPLRPKDDPHNLWNDYDIIEILEGSSNVIAYINGHNHGGDSKFKNGIHYITLFGMVDTKISSYGILEFYNDSLLLKGYGNQKNITIKF